ncbi:MAG: ArnT family glycosyltransferase [Thermoanaerobaculia bacterium]
MVKTRPIPPSVPTVPVVFLMSVPVVVGIALNVGVEALGAVSRLGSRTAWWIVLAFGAVAVVLALRHLYRHLERIPDTRQPRPEAFVAGAVLAILAVTLLTALVSPPNNYDALVYHNARVMQWWDHGDLGFWATPIDRQLRMPPLASYFRLSLYGLTGTDLFFNAVQWIFFLYAIFGAWALAESLAPGRKAGALAAILVATMPMALLQSTSSQNDLVCTGYVVAAAYFLVRVLRETAGSVRTDLALLGGAVGLACLTKGTAIPLTLPLLTVGVGKALLAAARSGRDRRTALAGAAAGIGLAALLNVPHAARVLSWFGSVESHYPEVVRMPVYLEDGIGTGGARVLSQLTRNGVLQLGQLRLLGVRSTSLTGAAARLHTWLGLDVDDPSITFGRTHFAEARWQLLNHEDTAPSTFHFLLALLAPGLLLARRFSGTGLRRPLGMALAVGWLLWTALCLSVAFMPWNQRLQLPALVLLMAPAAALWSAMPRAGRLVSVVALTMSLPYLFLNYSRPLVGVGRIAPESAWWRLWTGGGTEEFRSVLATPRWDNYFRSAPNYRKGIESCLQEVAAECPDGAVVSLRVGGSFPEYLLWAGARHAGRDFRFRHLREPAEAGEACAVIRGASGAVEVLRDPRAGGP